MNAVLNLVSWGVCSVLVTLYMEKVTRRRGDRYYQRNKYTIAAFAVLVVLSMVCGYVIDLKAVSAIAGLRLAISYFSILGAAVIDWKLHIIPNFISGFLVLARLLLLGWELIQGTDVRSDVLDSIFGVMICMIIITIANRFSGGGIGKGDLKLLMSLGFMCGAYIVFTTFLFALFCCAIISVLLVFFKKCTMKDCLAFGPFIYAGYVVMILFSMK